MRLLDSEIDIDANKYSLFTQYRAYLIILICSMLMDAASTVYFMGRIGPIYELNFVVRTLSIGYGPVFGTLVGKFYQLFGVWVLTVMTPKLTKFVCATIIIMNCYAFVLNMSL